jgi:cystathionine beta-lyase
MSAFFKDETKEGAEHPSTAQIHHPYEPPAGWSAFPPGVFKASTVLFKDTHALHTQKRRDPSGYTYGLHATPTTYTLTERIASLEGGRLALLTPSGMAAVALVNMALLRQGDEVLIPDNVYGSNREMLQHFLPRLGITHRVYDPLDSAALAAMLSPQTRLVWIEAAGSITLEFPDVLGIIDACQARGIRTVMDNTWGAGLAFNPFALPGGRSVDVSMQALTKYPSGGADVLMGSVTTNNPAFFAELNLAHISLGYGIAANDAELVLRGLPSMALRYEAQGRTALALARWMQALPQVAQVLHPALADSPGHAHWQELCGSTPGMAEVGGACLFSVVFKPEYTSAQVDVFVDRLSLFGIGYSWAGPMSLAVPYSLKHSRSMTRPDAHGHLVRFAIGLEALPDLQADLERALGALGGFGGL